MPGLTTEQLHRHMAALPDWEVVDGRLTKTYVTRSFAHAVLFVGAVAQLAEAANHHPDLAVHSYSKVTVSLSTHSEGGITERDCEMAAQIDALPHKKPKS